MTQNRLPPKGNSVLLQDELGVVLIATRATALSARVEREHAYLACGDSIRIAWCERLWLRRWNRAGWWLHTKGMPMRSAAGYRSRAIKQAASQT